MISPHSALCQVQSCELETDLSSTEHQPSLDSSASILDQIKLGNSILTSEQKHIVQQLLLQYSDVFSMNDMDIGFTGLVSTKSF